MKGWSNSFATPTLNHMQFKAFVHKLSQLCIVFIFYQLTQHPVEDPEGERGGTAPSEIDKNLAKLAYFPPILASMPPPN